jgi:hypothetical protein
MEERAMLVFITNIYFPDHRTNVANQTPSKWKTINYTAPCLFKHMEYYTKKIITKTANVSAD